MRRHTMAALTVSPSSLPPPPPIPNEEEVELSGLGALTYQLLLPIIASLGLAGNLLCVIVLMRRRFRRHASYVYLRALVWADSAYLVLTLQICKNAEHFFLLGAMVHQTSNSYAFEVYLVDFVAFLNNALGTTADLFILLMTIDRFHLLNNITKLNGGARKSWIIRFELFLAFSFCIGCHVPLTFQHEISPCDEIRSTSNDTDSSTPAYATDEDLNCIVVTHTALTQDSDSGLWRAYVVIVQVVLRILPTAIIFGFNIWIYFRLKRISRRRKKFKASKKNPKPVIEPPAKRLTTISASSATTDSMLDQSQGQTVIPDIVVEPPTPEPMSLNTILDWQSAAETENSNGHTKKCLGLSTRSALSAKDAVRTTLGLSLSAAALSVSFADSEDVISIAPSDHSALSARSSAEDEELYAHDKQRQKHRHSPIKWMWNLQKYRIVPWLTSREIKASQLVLFIAATHVVLATPANVMFIFYLYDEQIDENRNGYLICLTHTLLVLNYSINFLLYCVGNRNVREEAFSLIFRCKHIYWGDWQKGTLNQQGEGGGRKRNKRRT